MFCKNCGTKFKDGEDNMFCEGCGSKKEEETKPVIPEEPGVPSPPPIEQEISQPPHDEQQTPAPPPEPPIAVVSDDVITKSPNPPPPSAQNEQTPPAKKKPPVALIAIIAGLAIALGIGAYFLFFSGDGGGGSGARAIPDVERITRELSQDGRSIVPRDQKIESVEILDEETNRDEWTHVATVKIDSHDDKIAYIQFAQMSYYRDEEREWVLSGISAERMNQWTTAPLVGASEELINSSARSSLLWQNVIIDGDDWHIDDSVIENVIISNHNTDLNNRRDTVTATITLGSEAMTAEGQIELEFVFDNGWSLSNQRGTTPFVSQYRPNAVMELSNEQLLDELVRGDASILREMYFEGQSVTMARNEISNFAISDYESSNKGASRVYNFSFNLEKGIITYNVDAQVYYHFDGMSGWIPGQYRNPGVPAPAPAPGSDGIFSFTPRVSAVALEGTRWIGTYSPNTGYRYQSTDMTQTQLIIEVVEVSSDYALRTTLIGSPPEISQTSIGTFDISNLTINLIFDEWKETPALILGTHITLEQFLDRSKINITGKLSADGLTIINTGRQQFEVTLTDSVPEPAPAPAADSGDDEEDNGEE